MPITGEVRLYAGTGTLPSGWKECNGGTTPFTTALGDVLGTTYGDAGPTVIVLPDLRGRFPLGAGSGPGLTTRTVGTKLGDESVTLTVSNLPSHRHNLLAITQGGNDSVPNEDDILAKESSGAQFYSSSTTADVEMTGALSMTGDNSPHENMPPSLTLRYKIFINETTVG